MRPSARAALAWTISGLVALSCAPARASLQLCNRTSYVLYAATAIQQADLISTRGWKRLFPGDCTTAVDGPLKAPAYFVYARSPSPPAAVDRSWGGQFQFCVQSGDFALQERVSAPRCNAKTAYEVPFAPVATAGAVSWTMTLTESAALASPDMARAAGFRRLLDQIGHKSAYGDKALSEALARFRLHAKLPSNAPADALFAALEAEAVRTEAPQGYSICNDGNADIWAALGMKSGTDFVSHGWWEISAGKCISPIEQALGQSPVYLFVSKEGEAKLVSGPEPFCIADKGFEIRGQNRCKARGYLDAGFLPTHLQGTPGFVAHVGKGGLVDAQARTSK